MILIAEWTVDLRGRTGQKNNNNKFDLFNFSRLVVVVHYKYVLFKRRVFL